MIRDLKYYFLIILVNIHIAQLNGSLKSLKFLKIVQIRGKDKSTKRGAFALSTVKILLLGRNGVKMHLNC